MVTNANASMLKARESALDEVSKNGLAIIFTMWTTNHLNKDLVLSELLVDYACRSYLTHHTFLI